VGVDIAYVVEVLTDGKWVGIFTEEPWNRAAELYDRSYQLWAKLIKAQNPGVPDNASDLTRYHMENSGPNIHYLGWLPLKDVCRIYVDYAEKHGGLREHTAPSEELFGSFLVLSEPYQYRVVFWLDGTFFDHVMKAWQEE
jgi:hypothetical protein